MDCLRRINNKHGFEGIAFVFKTNKIEFKYNSVSICFVFFFSFILHTDRE